MSGGIPPGGPDILGDLEFLEHHWGSAYLVGAEGGGYTADRRDASGATLAAADRDGLCCEIQADYTADPASRDLSEELPWGSARTTPRTWTAPGRRPGNGGRSSRPRPRRRAVAGAAV